MTEKFLIFLTSSFSRDKKNELFTYIWTNYRRRIFFYLTSIVSASHPYLEDLFQEVMIKIYSNLEHYNPAHSFKGWIFTISRNHCFDFLKSKSQRMHHTLEMLQEEIPDTKNPETTMLALELNEKIDHFINNLNPLYKEIAFLRFYEHLKYKQIAQILGLSMDVVKARIRLIKLKLKKYMRRYI